MNAANDLSERIAYVRQALHNTPGAPLELVEKAKAMQTELDPILIDFFGDRTISSRNENPPTSLSSRLRTLAYTHSGSTADVTQTERDAYTIIKDEFTPLYTKLKKLMEVDLVELENSLEEIKAPWTPGRLPKWEE